MKKLDLVGYKFGELIVTGTAPSIRNSVSTIRMWDCLCGCGNRVIRSTSHLRSGKPRNCGSANHVKLIPHRKASGESGFNIVINKYKKRAREAGRSFDLSVERLRELFASPCYYCDLPPSNVVSRPGDLYGQFVYSGLDRVDSSGGYTEGNVVPCCYDCNIAKNDRSVEDFIKWVKKVAQVTQSFTASI